MAKFVVEVDAVSEGLLRVLFYEASGGAIPSLQSLAFEQAAKSLKPLDDHRPDSTIVSLDEKQRDLNAMADEADRRMVDEQEFWDGAAVATLDGLIRGGWESDDGAAGLARDSADLADCLLAERRKRTGVA